MNTKRTIFWATGTLLVVMGGWLISSSQKTPIYTNVNTTNTVLQEKNAHYDEGKRLMEIADYMGAKVAFEAALPLATDDTQRGQIEYNIADALAASGDALGAIPLFKKVVANQEYPPIRRAGAVLAMSRIYSQVRAFGKDTNEITKEIFKDEPYTSLYVSGDTALSYRKLSEYASGFFPLALSELTIALWHADDLESKNTAALSTSTPFQLALIKEKLANADADIESMRVNPNQHWIIPTALMYEGLVTAKLFLAGIGSTDVSFSASSTETHFQEALTSVPLYGLPISSDGFIRLHYASFIARAYGSTRKSDIQTLLAPLYDESIYAQSAIGPYLKSIARSADQTHNTMQTISDIDSDFKKYLMQLGWTSVNFK